MKNTKSKVFTVTDVTLDSEFHFAKCIFCQADRSAEDKLINPTNDGYASLSRDVARFIESYSDILPKYVVVLFQDQVQFEEMCKERKAVYHKRCRNEYDNQKLNRLDSRRKKLSDPIVIESCVFCKNPDHLSTVSSMDTLSKIVHQAELSNDHSLMLTLSKFTQPSDIKYHKTCYVKHFNPKAAKGAAKESNQNDFRQLYSIVLHEIIDRIEKTRHSPEQEFFKLSHLAKIMDLRLKEMGYENSAVHSSRLKDQLISQIGGLRAEKLGREIFLFFDDNVKHLVANAIENDTSDDDAILEQSVEILRRTYLAENTVNFSGSLNKTFCAQKTVPKKLTKYVSALMEGWGSNSNVTERIAENIGQIILFNCVKRRKNAATYARHNIDREQPLPIYIGLMIHSETGQRKMVDELNAMGFSISYSRVLDIERALATKVCDKYVQDDCVCPLSLSEGVFTTAAIDNIDHNPSSSLANYSFHGTGISLIQHFNNQHNEDSKQSIVLDKSDFSNKRKPCLPDSYYNIPLVPSVPGELPVSTVNWYTDANTDKTRNPLEYTKKWLENWMVMDNENSCENGLSWGAFNSRHSLDKSSFKSTSAMLPLLKDDINSPAVVMHALDIVIAATKKLNPNQTPVNTADEPVYAIAKQLQWLYPKKYGEDKLVLMLGGLHIEKSFLAVIGTWLQDSGWDEALVKAGITTPGRCDGILKSTYIKRARYAHEVSLAALNIVLFEQFESDTESLDIDYFQWIENKRRTSCQFQYWIIVMELESILLQFVKCVRNADIDEFVKVVEQMCPWYLVTDHGHYGRWMPVFLSDLKRLPEQHPTTYREFKKGHFTSRKSNKKFSCISDDQLHEQNNKLVKESATLLGALNDETSLVKWMVSGPELTRIIMEYRDLSSSDGGLNHHEDTKSFQSTFRQHVKALVTVFRSKGPFCTSELTTIGIERKVMTESSVDNVMKASEIGLKKYQDYVFDRLVTTKLSIHETIKQSQLRIFKVLPEKSINKDKMKLSSANADSNLFCRLFIACESREGNIEEFFNHENNINPPSISEFGKLRQLTAGPDEMVKCFYKSNTLENPASDVKMYASALVVDVSSVLTDLPPKISMTVKEYSHTIFNKFIYVKCESYNRVDVVFESSQENSLIQMTRENPSTLKYLSIIDNDTKLPTTKKLFANFLNNWKMKNQLIKLLESNLIESLTFCENRRMYTTEDSIVILNTLDYEVSDLSSISLSREDTNARLLLHVENAVYNGHESITVSTHDFNVIVVALYAFKYITPNIEKLWIEISNEGRKFTAAIHDLYETYSDISDALPFFHAFTGNYPTSSGFNGIGKKTAWKVWKKFDDLEPAISQLMNGNSLNWNEDSIAVLERFVMSMYDSTANYASLGECRRVLFSVKHRPIDRIPPTRDALEQHIRRALLQASIWTQCMEKNNVSLQPTDWGWITASTGRLSPKWTTIPVLADHCQELISCSCKGSTCSRCKCAKNKLPCTKLCTCKCDKTKRIA